jgi:hypothetical protein
MRFLPLLVLLAILGGCHHCHCDFRTDFLKEQKERADRYQEGCHAWINTLDMTPNEGTSVLVYEVQTRQFRLDMMTYDYSVDAYIWISTIYDDVAYDTYWRPLPKPPRI